ncbi:hypothetical protein GY45DRAFT_1418167 [Cubamyces sp. BRFM 1775]|nr:hypothetical protein GY45DRAFT_1418167 [Cubamyces sp. BRFM 1775]
MEETQYTRVVSTRDFLDNFLPFDSATRDRVYNAVVQREDMLYTCNRWAEFPPAQGKYKELALYPAFIKVANAIAKAARDEVGEREDQVREAVWVDYHSQAPQTLEEGATLIRPDCALAMAFADPSKAPPDKIEKLRWLQFVAAVEAKRNFDQNDQELISQLLTYLRLIMVEQKDRRFTFGLFLSNMQVSVWLQDRSGVLGMDVPINIHENPKDFIQVIAAFATLPAHRLGFDPTMKLAREPLPPIHTYRLTSQGPDRFTIQRYKTNNDVTQWVITTEQGTFITMRVLNVPRTDVASGSGCIIWAAIRYDDRAVEPDRRKVFVLKQLWQSDGRVDEGDIYEYLRRVGAETGDPDAKYIGKLEFHEIVKIEGAVDNTEHLIRRGLKPVQMHMTEEQQPRKRTRPTNLEKDEWLHVECVGADDMKLISRFVAGRQQEMKLPKRTRVRIVLGVFGCSVKFFSSVHELVLLLSQFIRGHRFAYKHGVVHRDISPANLLIALTGDDIPPSSRFDPYDVRGCLIDFDHAKRTQTVEERKVAFDADEVHRLTDLEGYRFFTRKDTDMVTDEVVHRAVHLIKRREPYISDAADITMHARFYIKAALERYKDSGRRPPPNNLYTPEALRWNVPLLHPPHAIRPVAERTGEVRSGTPPYISVKILNTKMVHVPWRRNTSIPSAVVHDAIHDMESFFWVLLYLCITRAGPGGERRNDLICKLDEIPVEQKMQVAPLHDLVHCLFDGDMAKIASHKKDLFEQPQNFEEQVLCHIHPYFEVLKPTLRRWWNLLVLAYAFEGYEYHNIHTLVLELLDPAVVKLAPPDDSQEDSQNAV